MEVTKNKNMHFGRGSGAGGMNALEDFLSAHYKKSYGIEGMIVKTSSRRIIKVSVEMKSGRHAKHVSHP